MHPMEEKKKIRLAVSACLLGEHCRYDGKCKVDAQVLDFSVKPDITILAVCPEREGGLPTPRTPCEIQGGDGNAVVDGKARVVSSDGEDRTEAFLEGARVCLELVKKFKPDGVMLKDGSPSCGIKNIHDGTFKGVKRPGIGVLTCLLGRAGFFKAG
jgi:uncharacterized protein YbbK (DUF523 family)